MDRQYQLEIATNDMKQIGKIGVLKTTELSNPFQYDELERWIKF